MNTVVQTLVQGLQNSAAGDRSITYIKGKSVENTVSYSDLWNRAISLLGYLQRHGVTAGDELILFLEDNEQFVDTFWSAMIGGIVAVPLTAGATDFHHQKLFNVFRKLKNPILYITQNNLSRLQRYTQIRGLEEDFQQIRSTVILADG